MFNPNTLAKEVFNTLRSFDYTVDIFDFDGNKVIEPELARRFFATPKNITISLQEDSENSKLRVYLSHSIDVAEVMGMLETLRMICSKYNILINVRKYDKELTLKDLAPHLDENIGDTLIKGDNRVRRIDEKRGDEMIFLPALDVEVEKTAWEDFKNGKLEMYSIPDISGGMRMQGNTLLAFKLSNIATRVQADGMANMLAGVAVKLSDGANDVLLKHIANVAIHAVFPEGIHESDEECSCTDIKEISESTLEKYENGDLIIMTESVKDFGNWFNSLSSIKIFESLGDDDFISKAKHSGGDGWTKALDLAIKLVDEEFTVEEFLSVNGSDFYYGDGKYDSEEDRQRYNVDPDLMTITKGQLETSLQHYIQTKVEDAMGDEVHDDVHDIKQLVNDKLPSVEEYLIKDGYMIVNDETEDEDQDYDFKLEEDDEYKSSQKEKYYAAVNKKDWKTAKKIGERIFSKKVVEDDEELTQEDILLPANKGQDFSDDVIVQPKQGDDDIDRLKSLAGIRK